MERQEVNNRTVLQGRELFSDTRENPKAETLVNPGMVGPGGLEPPTSPLSGARSHHLS